MHAILLAVAISVAAPDEDATLRSCGMVEALPGPTTVAPLATRMRFEGGRVTAVFMDMPDGRTTSSFLEPAGPGLSRRAMTVRRGDADWYALANEVAVEGSGTVFVQTWIRLRAPPHAETRSWARFRCSDPPVG